MHIIKVLFIFFWMSNCYGETYRLATGEFPPFTGASLESQGLATKIIQHTIREMGHQTKIDFLPWKRGYKLTLAGNYLGTFPYSKNQERQKQWHYSSALYRLKEVFFSQKEKNFSFNTEDDLTGFVVCKPIGYNLFDLKRLIEKNLIQIQRPNEMKQCFAMLDRGRVDLVMTNVAAGRKAIELAGLNFNHYDVTDKAFVDIGHHLIVPKSRNGGKEFLAVFDEVLRKSKNAGIVDKYMQEYLQ